MVSAKRSRAESIYSFRPAKPPGRVRVLAFRPEPNVTRVVRMPIGPRTVTTIVRHWDPGTARMCRLCPTCTVHEDVCLVMTTIPVADIDAPTFEVPGAYAVAMADPQLRAEGGAR